MTPRRLTFVLLAVALAAVLVKSQQALAYATGTYGSADYGMCDYGAACSISLSSNGNVTINATPGSGGKCTIQSDTATVLTDDSNGYTLTLADNTTNTSLTNGGNSIPATSGTLAAPSTLGANFWGYRVDGLGSFGSGPTTAQSNISPSSALFAGVVPSTSSPDVLANTTSIADPAVTTTIWYGVCANQSQPSGPYSTQVTYTALAN